MRARAFIAVPLPPPSTWRLLRTARDLPDGYTIIGSIEVGRADPPALSSPQTPAKQSAPTRPRALCAECPLRAQLLDQETPP